MCHNSLFYKPIFFPPPFHGEGLVAMSTSITQIVNYQYNFLLWKRNQSFLEKNIDLKFGTENLQYEAKPFYFFKKDSRENNKDNKRWSYWRDPGINVMRFSLTEMKQVHYVWPETHQ